MPHVDDGTLHAYLDGELPAAERDRCTAHLAECAACRDHLEEERALRIRARDLLALAVPPVRERAAAAPLAHRRPQRWQFPLAWAATVMVAFAVGWYAQGERLARELAGRAAEPAASAPKAKSEPAPRRFGRPRATPPLVAQQATENAAAPLDREARHDAAPAAVAGLVPRDEAAEWLALDADAARQLLGRAPAVLPGHAVRRMVRNQTEDGVVLVEQEPGPGIVIRLYERAAGPVQRARKAALLAAGSERLARYIGALRVEIAGPLTPDSLSRLLNSVE